MPGFAGRDRGPDRRHASGPRRYKTQADDPPGTSRLFIAVPLADDVREGIGALMSELAGAPIDERAPGQPRWVRVDGLHITLRFLGATPDVRVQELGDIVTSAARGVAPFRVELTGGGAFPGPDRPRVLWIGIGEGANTLAAMARNLDVELARLGWTPDDRPFNPHLTLARTDGVPGADERARRLIELGRDVRLSWTADRLVLYRSNLGHGPAHYEALATAELA
jgi:RNA 2',3'-cyclic 3'-phosphodiesterase